MPHTFVDLRQKIHTAGSFGLDCFSPKAKSKNELQPRTNNTRSEGMYLNDVNNHSSVYKIQISTTGNAKTAVKREGKKKGTEMLNFQTCSNITQRRPFDCCQLLRHNTPALYSLPDFSGGSLSAKLGGDQSLGTERWQGSESVRCCRMGHCRHHSTKRMSRPP